MYLPLKGRAVYWWIEVGDNVSEDAIWSYTGTAAVNPMINDLLAFHPGKVDSLKIEGEVCNASGADPALANPAAALQIDPDAGLPA